MDPNRQTPYVISPDQAAQASQPGQVNTTTPVNTQPTYITGSMLATAENRRKSKIKTIRNTVLGLLGIIVVGFAALVVVDLFNHSLRATQFDNGKGAKFSLIYYGGYSIKTDASGTKVLQAPDVKHTGVPLILDLTETNQGANINLCDETKYTLMYSVKMTANGEVNKVCALSQGNKPIIYFMQFHQNSKNYLAMVLFNANGGANAATAQATLNGVNFSLYDDDLKTILPSIKALTN